MADEGMTSEQANKLNQLLEKLLNERGKTAKAGGGMGDGKMATAFSGLYKTVGDADAAITKPFSQTGKAVQDLGDIVKQGIPSWLPFGDTLEKFVGIVSTGGGILAERQQELINETDKLSGSAILSVNSFSEMTNQLQKSNLQMDDFIRVQAQSANFLSTMGGELRSASDQAKLLSDVTNTVNDDFEKLGQMGVNLADKQQLQADSMDLLRQIGLKQGETNEKAAALVSGAMQNMAMESNKMAALTGADRRKTLEAMAEKTKSDQSVAVSAKMIADQNGLTAEQTANLRVSLAAVEKNIETAFPGGMGQDMQKAVDLAARTGIDFNTALGKINPELAVALTKNQEFSNGMTNVINTLREGGEIDVANLGELNKKFETSVDKNYTTTLSMTDSGLALAEDIYQAMVNINAQSAEAASNVETETDKLSKSAQGQAANMAQVMKDGLTQAKNASRILVTVGTEVFNDNFADNAKSMRDSIKTAGDVTVGSATEIRDAFIGTGTLSEETTAEMERLMGLGMSQEAARQQAALSQLNDMMATMGFQEGQMNAIREAMGASGQHATNIANEQETVAALVTATNKKAQEMLSSGVEITENDLITAANELGVPVNNLKTSIDTLKAATASSSELVEAQTVTQGAYVDKVNALSTQQQKAFQDSASKIAGIGAISDEKYDSLIQGILDNKTVELGGSTRQLFENIKDASNSQEIINQLIALNNKDSRQTELDGLTTEIRALIDALKARNNAPADDSTEQQTNKMLQAQEGFFEKLGKRIDEW